MPYIWIDDHSRLKSYSASVKGPKSIVKIEIECSEPASLGYLLEHLGETKRDQDKPKPRPEPGKPKRLALPAPALQLEFKGRS